MIEEVYLPNFSLGRHSEFWALFRKSKMADAAILSFFNFTKILSDTSFPMVFGLLNTMQVLIFGFGQKLTLKGRVNVIILAKNEHFQV